MTWNPADAVQWAVEGLTNYQVHAAHRRYFGLFNPAPTAMGVAAEALVASFNPQVASLRSCAFAVEVEQHLIRFFGSAFGYDPRDTGGTFASGDPRQTTQPYSPR